MLAWYERTYKDTPDWFSAKQFPFLRRNKATMLSTSNLLLSNGSKTLELDKYSRKLTMMSHSSWVACHLGIANLERILKRTKYLNIGFVFQESLSPSGKLPVRNVTAKLAILEYIMKRKGFHWHWKADVQKYKIVFLNFSTERKTALLKTGKGFPYMVVDIMLTFVSKVRRQLRCRCAKYKIFYFTK